MVEGLADPGGICVLARVQEDVTCRLGLAFEDLGEPFQDYSRRGPYDEIRAATTRVEVSVLARGGNSTVSARRAECPQNLEPVARRRAREREMVTGKGG